MRTIKNLLDNPIILAMCLILVSCHPGVLEGDIVERNDRVSISKTPVGLQPWAVGGLAQAVAAISENIPIIVSRIHLKYNDGSFHFSNSISQDTGPHRWCKSPSSFKIHLKCVRSDGPLLLQFVMRTQNERTQTEGQVLNGANLETLFNDFLYKSGGAAQVRERLWQMYVQCCTHPDELWGPEQHADTAQMVYFLCELVSSQEGGVV